LTAEQLEASRAERMRQNGHGALTIEDARTWIEETGLCLFLPKRQFSASIAPSFVEAIAGRQDQTPDPAHIKLAEELLVRLEHDDVAVRLNLLGQPGEQPDFVVASWVLPYVYALRGDRDWRRNPQLTGSRQVSQLAVNVYKHLEAADTTIPQLKHALGREVTEVAVLRAITELWQQLRIIPVISAPGQPAKWQLLRHRYQKAIAEGASTSQVTAISVLASIYLQAVIAASMEEVELFLAPLTARSKVREVLRGLVATRQVHTISLGHAPHFYVAGTLPEFAAPATLYASSSMSSSYFLRTPEREEDHFERNAPKPAQSLMHPSVPPPVPVPVRAAEPQPHVLRTPAPRKPVSNGKPAAPRPHFSRPSAHTRDRKPAQSSSGNRPVRRPAADTRTSSRTAGARPAAPRTGPGARPASAARWTKKASPASNSSRTGARAASSNGTRTNGAAKRPVVNGTRSAKPTSASWSKRNGHSNGAKPAGKLGANGRSKGLARNGTGPRKDARTDARSNRKPALAAGAKAGNSKQYGFTARPKRETKKRG
jgi:23S rRNA pseudouridine2605 synthase